MNSLVFEILCDGWFGPALRAKELVFPFVAVPSKAEMKYWDLLFGCHKTEIKARSL